MITRTHIELLFSALSAPAASFSTRSDAALLAFTSHNGRWGIATVLAIMLRIRILLPTPIRLPAIYLAFTLFSHSHTLPQHPFMPILLAYLQSSHPCSHPVPVSLHEQFLIALLLKGHADKLVRLVPADLVRGVTVDTCLLELREDSFLNTVARLRDAVLEGGRDATETSFQSQPVHFGRVAGVQLLPEDTGFGLDVGECEEPTLEEAMNATIEIFAVDTFEEQLSIADLEMPLIIPPPPLMVPSVSELVWLDPIPPLDPVAQARKKKAHTLLQDSLTRPLRTPDIALIAAEIRHDARFALECGLTPHEHLPLLLEHNVRVAIEVLKGLLAVCAADDWLDAILRLPLGMSLLEVVGHLAGLMKPHNVLGEEFMHLFVARVCRLCEMASDRANEARNVRLVCVFFQSLLKDQVIQIQEYEVELEQFCIQWSKYKEASDLFQLIRCAQFGE